MHPWSCRYRKPIWEMNEWMNVWGKLMVKGKESAMKQRRLYLSLTPTWHCFHLAVGTRRDKRYISLALLLTLLLKRTWICGTIYICFYMYIYEHSNTCIQQCFFTQMYMINIAKSYWRAGGTTDHTTLSIHHTSFFPTHSASSNVTY